MLKKGYISGWDDFGGFESNTQEDVEYTVQNPNNEQIASIENLGTQSAGDMHPWIIVHTINGNLEYINLEQGIAKGEFKIEKIRDLPNEGYYRIETTMSKESNASDWWNDVILYESDDIRTPKYKLFKEVKDGEFTGVIYSEIYNDEQTTTQPTDLPTENDNQKQDNSSIDFNADYKTFNVNDGVIKQYNDGKNTVTIKLEDIIKDFEEYKDNIITYDEEYVITGINTIIKDVFCIIKDRSDTNISKMYILGEDGVIYEILAYSHLVDTENKTWTSAINGNIDYKVEQVLQERAEEARLITNTDKVYKRTYNEYVEVGSAPSKETVYDCVIDYCNESKRWDLSEEQIENMKENSNIYYFEENGKYKANVETLVNDKECSQTRNIIFTISYGNLYDSYKVEQVDENTERGI